MKRLAKRGFTLVEIMIVVAIIALLAAIAIPNVLRGRATANESAAIGNLRALVSSLEMYRSVYQAYPIAGGSGAGQFQNGLYLNASPPFGPPSFNVTMADNTIQGFQYNYNRVGGLPAQQYVLRARPNNFGQTGTRSFFATESGQIFHCSANSTTVNVPTNSIDLQPDGTCP